MASEYLPVHPPDSPSTSSRRRPRSPSSPAASTKPQDRYSQPQSPRSNIHTPSRTLARHLVPSPVPLPFPAISSFRSLRIDMYRGRQRLDNNHPLSTAATEMAAGQSSRQTPPVSTDKSTAAHKSNVLLRFLRRLIVCCFGGSLDIEEGNLQASESADRQITTSERGSSSNAPGNLQRSDPSSSQGGFTSERQQSRRASWRSRTRTLSRFYQESKAGDSQDNLKQNETKRGALIAAQGDDLGKRPSLLEYLQADQDNDADQKMYSLLKYVRADQDELVAVAMHGQLQRPYEKVKRCGGDCPYDQTNGRLAQGTYQKPLHQSDKERRDSQYSPDHGGEVKTCRPEIAEKTERTVQFMEGNSDIQSVKEGGDVFDQSKPISMSMVYKLAKLDANMESKFEQVIKAIHVVGEQVRACSSLNTGSNKEHRHSEALRPTKNKDDTDQANSNSSMNMAASTNTSSRTMLTAKSEFSSSANLHDQPLDYYNGRSLPDPDSIPIRPAFQEVVERARLKLRVLTGLLIAEKDAKLMSARDFSNRKLMLVEMMSRHMQQQGNAYNLIVEKPWHIKYALDHCVNFIFFRGGLHRGASSSRCTDHALAHHGMPLVTFCESRMRGIEAFIGCEEKAWSGTLREVCWETAVCCWQVYTLLYFISGGSSSVRVLHPLRCNAFDECSMDPLDTADFYAFQPTVLFTIFSGFMVEERILCKAQVYLEPKNARITLHAA